MGEYGFLWRGKDRGGTIRAERVRAENAQQAKARLLDEGWSELELIKDEITASEALKVESDPCMADEANEFDTPEYEAKFFEGKGPGILGQTWLGIKDSWLTIVMFAAIFGFGYFFHKTWPMVIGAVVVAFLVLLTPILHVVFKIFGKSSKEYDRLNRAKVWGRWNEVIECVEALEKPDALTGAKIPEIELVKCRAQAYAAQGRLENGLKVYTKLENDPKIEQWLYLTSLATVYDAGKAHEQALNIRRQVAIEKPDNSSVWIDLAYSCVRHLNRPGEAREFLAKAEALEITGLGKAYLPFLCGIIFWREGKMSEAIKQFEKALPLLKPWTTNPLAEGLILLSKSHLCACHRAQDNRAKADKLYREVKKFLQANKEDELISACKGAKVTNS